MLRKTLAAPSRQEGAQTRPATRVQLSKGTSMVGRSFSAPALADGPHRRMSPRQQPFSLILRGNAPLVGLSGAFTGLSSGFTAARSSSNVGDIFFNGLTGGILGEI